MNKVVENIKEIDLQQWADLIAESDHGNFFQSEAFYRLAEASTGFRPYLVQVYEDGRLQGSLLAVKIKESNGLKGLFSSRTVVYGGPIISHIVNSKQSIVNSLLASLCVAQRKSIFIQFRNFFDLSEYKDVFEKHGFILRDRLNFLVRLDTHENVWKRMSENRRRQIKSALMPDAGYRIPDEFSSRVTRHTSRVSLQPASDIGQVRRFYEILYDLYRNKVKKPLPSWSFFENFHHMTLEKPGSGVILLVLHDGDIIGGILCPISPGKSIYEWYVCGLDDQYKELSPSTLATWAALDYGLKNNIPQFDFMGVGTPNKPYGVREFKRRFGGEMVNYGRYSRVNNKLLYFIAEVGYNLLALVNKI